ncbi:hypothetical protein Agabi119p4_2751 [Agaricus bisporus var. burnettii]|uniref:Uncharacterized protein n=1 Tax=Agaricus bisporus var. burnettii TaxID=192524 RepID=A0A8H7F5U1_AGABI|nr:hypothetical protein Agabi119p4_2751 [Agaricus bisporus var. burnettii]
MSQSLAGKFKFAYKGGEVSASRTWGTIQTSRVYIDNRDNGEFAKWEVVPAENNSELYIRNVGVGDYSCGEPSPNTRVIGKEENKTAWCIEQSDGNSCRIRYPNRDLYWTAIPVRTQIPGRVAWEIFLESGDSTAAEQRFELVRVEG